MAWEISPYCISDDEAPSRYCRVCDCVPCACGKNDFRSNGEIKEQENKEKKHYDWTHEENIVRKK